MSKITLLTIGFGMLASLVVVLVRVSSPTETEAAPTGAFELPADYRDWRLISVAREAGEIDDIRAILGNDAAVAAYRSGSRPFPDGAVLARIAWSYDASPENDAVFGRRQSFVAGAPKNGVQFMVKDSQRYASTGGWGFAQFDEGEPVGAEKLATCFTCHAALPQRDFVFTRYAR